MTNAQLLADRFEAQRAQLRAVAYRMLGSASDADDFMTRTFPNIRDHLVERRMDWIYLGMNCRR